jgi:hypothetical protein
MWVLPCYYDAKSLEIKEPSLAPRPCMAIFLPSYCDAKMLEIKQPSLAPRPGMAMFFSHFCLPMVQSADVSVVRVQNLCERVHHGLTAPHTDADTCRAPPRTPPGPPPPRAPSAAPATAAFP